MNTRPFSTIGWGLFCACSWTWCIGMFLPIILLRELGWPGVLVFAVPNVIGCAAFGYVIRTRRISEGLVARHLTAGSWFSIVTIAFHAYFAGFVAITLLGTGVRQEAIGVAAAIVLLGAGLAMSRMPGRAWPIAAVVVYGISLATFASLGVATLADLPASGVRPPAQIAWFTAVLLFGFALCPYLDLTFHRALQMSGSRHAFAVFGVAFAVMIGLTCAYRDRLAVLAIVPFAHILAQSVFTVAAHLRELRVTVEGGRWSAAGALAIPCIAALLVFAVRPNGPAPPGEMIYLRFLVFYGLVFPAYVLMFVGPGRVADASPRNLIVFAAGMIAALPFYELGFVGGRPWLLVFPLAGLAAARLVLLTKDRTPDGSPLPAVRR